MPVLTTDIKVDVNGSPFKHKHIYLSNTISSIPPVRTSRAQATGPLTPQQVARIEALKRSSASMHLHYDGNGESYYVKLDANGEPTTDADDNIIRYQRVTQYISDEKIEETNLLKSAQNIGTGIDTLTRKFFDKGKKD